MEIASTKKSFSKLIFLS